MERNLTAREFYNAELAQRNNSDECFNDKKRSERFEEELCRTPEIHSHREKGREILVPDENEKFHETAYVKDIQPKRSVSKYSAKNCIRRVKREDKKFIDYSAIDKYLQNEKVITIHR